MASNTIEKINVSGISYKIIDATIEDHVRNITQEEIEAWNTSAEKASDYEKIENKPSINNTTLIGNVSGNDLGLQEKMYTLSNEDIENLIG